MSTLKEVEQLGEKTQTKENEIGDAGKERTMKIENMEVEEVEASNETMESQDVKAKVVEPQEMKEIDSWDDDSLEEEPKDPSAVPKQITPKDSWDDDFDDDDELEDKVIDGPPPTKRVDSWGMPVDNDDNENDNGWDDDFADADDMNPDAGMGTMQVSRETFQDVKKDVLELNFMNGLCSAHSRCETGDRIIRVAIGMNVSGLNLTQLQREIYALEITDIILIKVEFDSYYMGGARPKILEVGKVPQGTPITANTASRDFMFTWTCKDRLQNTFVAKNIWPPEMGERLPDCFEGLCDMFGKPLSQVSQLLIDVNNSENRARDHLMNEKPVKVRDLHNCYDDVTAAIQSWTKKHPIATGRGGCPITCNVQDMWYAMQHNWFARIVLFIADTIFVGNKTCMICDGPQEYVGWKPSICENTQCQFQYGELGLGFSLAHEVVNNSIIMDMYISMIHACTQMGDRIKLCYPEKITAFGKDVPKNQKSFMRELGQAQFDKLAKQTSRRHNYVEEKVETIKEGEKAVLYPQLKNLQDCVAQIPGLTKMRAILDDAKNHDKNPENLHPDIFLKKQLNCTNYLIHPLLKFLVQSNRAYMRLLKDDERFPEIKTDYQFVFANASPEKEMNFQRLRKEAELVQGKGKGVIQAWHGSGFGNWHSILRNGLKNMSNTKWMSCAAAYGAGIYLSPNFTTSLGYSRTTGKWNKSELGAGQTLYALALCELINDKKLPKPNPHYVIPQEDWVMTRFFFIFVGNQNKGTNVKLPLPVPKKLKALFSTWD